MQMKQMRVRSIGIIFSAVVFCAQMVSATSGIWTNGVVNKFWTNNLNWSASPYPSGNETATFTNSLAGKLQDIDLDGFIGCTNIVFDGPNIAHYRIGTNATLQTFKLISSTVGGIYVTGTAGSNQTFNSIVMLGTNAVAGTYTITNGASARTLTFSGAITNGTGGTAGTKTLNITGTGPIVANGGINSNSALNVTVNSTAAVTFGGPNTISTLTQNLTGSLTITGASTMSTLTQNSTGALAINAPSTIDTLTQSAAGAITITNATVKTLNLNASGGVVTIASGATLTFNNLGGNNLVATQDATINGPGVILLSITGADYANNSVANDKTVTVNAKMTGARGFEYYTGAATTGTFVLTAENDYTLETVFNQAGTIRFSMLRNRGVACNLGSGSVIRFKDNPGGRIQYVGLGDATDRDVVLKNNGIIDQSGSGPLKFTGPVYQDGSAANSILTLQGSTTGSGEISGPISNNHATATLGVTKAGAGTWTLTGVSSYKGATTVSGGTLVVAGTAGAITNTSGITISAGSTLNLLNRFTANHLNRLNDATAIAINGGRLDFSNNGGDANYSETIGDVTVNALNSTISASRAAAGKASTLILKSLTQGMGSINFVGEGLGIDARNRIFISTGQADGPIGDWATVNGTHYAMYSSTLGVYATTEAVPASAALAARGPDSVIPNSPLVAAEITTPGDTGPITLETADTRILSLQQKHETNAVVATAGQTLRATELSIQNGKGSLTIGVNEDDGTLTPLAAGGTLTLANADSISTLDVNAKIVDNGSASSVVKSGPGTVALKGTNSYTGTTSINEGQLVIGGAISKTMVSAIGGIGSLLKKGPSAITLSGANTFTGGLSIAEGKLVAANANALGSGPVALSSNTLDLVLSGVTYSGLSTALSGNGTVNVPTLGTGTTTVGLNGNYSGFTGVWNIGLNTVTNGGKIQMNGLDNAATTINLLSNATLYSSATVTHNATVNLYGGDMGETLGQLRLENASWAGRVNIKAPSTHDQDGLVGSNGTGYIPGVIDDADAGIVMDKAGAGMIVLSGSNTYSGATWVKQGTLQVPWLGKVADPASPLGKGGKIILGRATNAGKLQYSGTANDESDRLIEIASTTSNMLKHVGSGLWTLTGNVTDTVAGNKRLQLEGNAGTTGVLAGVISEFPGSTNILTKVDIGTWVLSGDNKFSGNIAINAGVIVAKHSGALGIGNKTVTMNQNSAATYHYQLHLDGAAGSVVLGTNISYDASNTSDEGTFVNLAGTNTIKGEIRNTSGGGGVAFLSKAGKLIFDGIYRSTEPTGGRSVFLRGDGDGEISGVIQNGTTANLPVNRDTGTGTWVISSANTFTGVLTVTTGKLAVGGVNGRLAVGIGVVINGGTFAIQNSEAASSPDRVDDANTVAMSGGTFSYEHPADGQTYSETLGTLTISSGTNTISASQASTDWNSTLTFASLTRTAGTVNFTGVGLGDNTQNKIFFTTPPVADDALIGTWATVNGTNFAAYSSTRGVYAAATIVPTGIAATGDVVTNEPTATVEITLEGTGGNDTLQGTPVNSVNILKQNSDYASTISMPSQTLKVSDILIGTGKAALTLGASANEGLVMALNAGDYLDLVNDSSISALTINAGVTNNGTFAAGLMKWGAGLVNIAGRVSYTGPTVVQAGTLEFSSSATQTLAGVISGVGTIIKSGTGQLTLSAANTYTGNLTISGGTVISGNDAALGSVDGETIINGGTLNFSAARNHGAERIQVQGSGVDGLGAIINNAAQSLNAFRFVTLTGHTTFGGTQRWDIRAAGTPATATFDMGGYTLTKTNVNYLPLVNVNVLNPGNVDVKQGSFSFEVGTAMGGSAANVLKVYPFAKMYMYQLTNPVPWSLIMEQDSTLQVDSTTLPFLQNIWNGPVTLNGIATFAAANTFTVNGKISGSGGIIKTGAQTNYLNNSANDYAGTTIISNGTLYAKYAGSLPGYDGVKLTVAPGGILYVPVATNGAEFGWTSAQIGGISPNSFALSNSWLAVETFADFDHLSNFPQAPSSMGLRKLGVGTMTIPSNQALLGGLYVQGGGLVLNNVLWQTAQITTELAWLPGENASLTLSGNSVLAAFLNTNNAPNAQGLIVGRAGRATVVLKDNAIVTNKLYLGDAASSAGAVYQSGNSTMFNWGGSGNDGRLGNNGYGYYELNSGTFTNHGFFQMGGGSTTGTGVLVQKGGRFYQNNTYGGQFALNRGGTGIVYTDGGTFGTVNQIVLGETSGTSTTSGNAIFTADGNANVTIAGNITMSDRINAFSAFNLNGGTVSANQFSKGNRTGNSAFVNFDGGTFKSRVSGALFATGVNAPTTVSIYGGGAVFDTGAFTNTVDVALLAPTGKCVSAISITQGSGYIGAPAVIISGGGGAGATALANFDSASGTVTGIQITSPGAGYTSTPTVTLTGGSCTNVAVVVTGVLLANNVSGGLTKNGSGLLTLTAANTYTGPTVVNEGVLRLGTPGAIYMDSDIVINGGVLDLNGYTLVTRASVTVNAGSIVNGVIVSESLDKSTTSTATVGASVESVTPVTIAGGTYKLTATVATVQPGLLQGKISNNPFDTTSVNPCTVVTNSPAMGNSQTGWGSNETYIYSGYVWNRTATNVTWTFAEHIDDSALLKIDGNTVLNNGTWTVPTLGNYILTPGPHTFEARFGNGIGNAGPSTQAGTWFPANNSFGLGVDYSGRGATNIANFVAMIDPGDGSLFTTALPAFSENTSLALAAGATLDLNGTTQTIANLSGSGTVTNGTLVITGLVTPAGDSIGDLTFNCNLTITGRIVLDVSASDNDSLIVSGNLDVSGADLEVVNAASMPKQNYTIATASGTISGSPTGDFIPWIGNPDEKNWKVKQQGTAIRLIYLGGTILLFN